MLRRAAAMPIALISLSRVYLPPPCDADVLRITLILIFAAAAMMPLRQPFYFATDAAEELLMMPP